MSAGDRLQIFPSRGALVMLKSRISSATRGHLLLKRKIEALQSRCRKILADLISLKMNINDAVKDASFSLAEMRFVTGDTISPMIIETASKASTKIRTFNENVAGIVITVFESYKDGNDAYELAGLSRGGQQLASVKQKFSNLINLVVELASFQSSFIIFHEATKVTTRRVAGIENIVLPKLWNTLRYFESELDEYDREEFYRIKKLKAKKLRKNEKSDMPHERIAVPPDQVENSKCICYGV